eukprot:TRINITY_DN8063_c0_g1_i2.p1 TRINITY_DN8063_c0_g1~~TRINITY_DN8063_c0_g1_i2.p1  ORF type:complete len:667 (+),score=184.52 TRINITY_DN8063_c0_g1_i2:78-2003(+)
MADPAAAASAPPAGGSQSEWIERTDPSSGRVYYVHSVTGESQWEVPAAAAAPAPAAAQQQQHGGGGAHQSEWLELTDPGSGRVYYSNQVTGESSWERPADMDDPSGGQSQAAALTQVSADAESVWVETTDPASGRPYYVHRVTGESVWTLPEDAQQPPAEQAAPQAACGAAGGSPHAPSTGMRPPSPRAEHQNGPAAAIPRPPGAQENGQAMPRRLPHRTVSFGFGGVLLLGETMRGGQQRVSVVPLGSALDSAAGCSATPEGEEYFRTLAGHPGPLWDAAPQRVVEHLERMCNGDPGPLQRLLMHFAEKPYEKDKERWAPFVAALSAGLLAEDMRPPGDCVPEELRDDEALGVEERLRRALHRERAEHCEDRALLKSVQELVLNGGPAVAAKAAFEAGAISLAMTLSSFSDLAMWQQCLHKQVSHMDPWSPLYHVLLVAQNINSVQQMGPWDIERYDPGAWRCILLALLQAVHPDNRCLPGTIWKLYEALLSVGDTEASHFCYLVCAAGWPDQVKLHPLLIGGKNTAPPSRTAFVTPRAIFQTEVLEFHRRKKQTSYSMPQFDPYRQLLGVLQAELGLLKQAAASCAPPPRHARKAPAGQGEQQAAFIQDFVQRCSQHAALRDGTAKGGRGWGLSSLFRR